MKVTEFKFYHRMANGSVRMDVMCHVHPDGTHFLSFTCAERGWTHSDSTRITRDDCLALARMFTEAAERIEQNEKEADK